MCIELNQSDMDRMAAEMDDDTMNTAPPAGLGSSGGVLARLSDVRPGVLRTLAFPEKSKAEAAKNITKVHTADKAYRYPDYWTKVASASDLILGTTGNPHRTLVAPAPTPQAAAPILAGPATSIRDDLFFVRDDEGNEESFSNLAEAEAYANESVEQDIDGVKVYRLAMTFERPKQVVKQTW